MIDYKIGQRVRVVSAATRSDGVIRDYHPTVGIFVETDHPIQIRLGSEGPFIDSQYAWFRCSGNPISNKYGSRLGLAAVQPADGVEIIE